YRLYNGYAAGRKFYAYGIGSGFKASGEKSDLDLRTNLADQSFGYSMEERVDWMMSNLRDQLSSGDNIVDVVGFSRGSATAVRFLHAIQSEIDNENPLFKDIEIRIAVLFDSVPSK